MAFNPFLSMGEPELPTAEAVNPFATDPIDVSNLPDDNPFATSNSNPFADFGAEPATAVSSNIFGGDPTTTVPSNIFGGEPVTSVPSNIFGGDPTTVSSNIFGGEPAAGDTVPTDIFGGGLPAGARLFDAPTVFEPPERLVKPTELELSNAPVTTAHFLPPATQDLILSVTGHMEFTSSHLLGRIPLTRTPSPVSARDMVSPEPEGPELEADPEPEVIAPAPVPAPVRPAPPPVPPAPAALSPAPSALPPAPAAVSPTPPAVPPAPAAVSPAPPVVPPARPVPARPARPPVARPPPPRPAPPPVAPAPATDDINLFDAPVKVPVKPPTKEDILSLYSAPKKEEKPIDFLSDDLDAIPANMSPVVPMDIEPVESEGNPFEIAAESDLTPTPFSGADIFGTSSAGSAASQSPFAVSSPPSSGAVEPMIVSEDPGWGDHSATPQATNDVFPQEPMTQSPFAEKNSSFTETQTTTAETQSPFGESKDTFVENDAYQAFSPSQNAFSTSNETYTVSHNTFSGPDTFSDPQYGGFAEAPDPCGSVNIITDSQSAFSTSQNAFQAPSKNAFAPSEPAHAEQYDAFSESHDTFSESHDAFPGSHDAFPESQDAFDAFSAKFDSTSANHVNTAAWGDDGSATVATDGFEAEAFDPFLSMGAPPPPAATPRLESSRSQDSPDESFNIFIRPQHGMEDPRPIPRIATLEDRNKILEQQHAAPMAPQDVHMEPARRDSAGSGAETPPTPLFDEDVSMPLEVFPRTVYEGPGWEMHLRQPNKKKITGQRFWKKVFVRLAQVGDATVVQLRNTANDKEPFQELPLQACYSVSEIAAQQFDQFGKIFTVKLQYVFYKERPGVRPGQVTKAERITNKLSQFAAYAIQGDYQGVKEFGSDLRKLGLPVEHAPQVSQLFKLGSLTYEDVKQFSCCIEEALFRIPAHRDRALTYKMEEVQITAVDELYVEQDAFGIVCKQVARVRLFFLGFLSGMPDVELGVNDMRRQGKEVVGRHDIIPVATEEWIRVENQEFHACVQPEEFANTQIIRFKPPDACYIELMRFRVRPPKNRELPLQLKATWCVTGNKVELRADVLVPGFASRKLGQVPCEDVSIRFPIPESWIYLFRVEKHFRYGSVKSAHRRTGKVKGIERFLGAVDTLSESLIEVTSGQAKYEHQHRAIVWRMPRLPKEGQGAYTTHNLVSRMALTSYDQIPAELAKHAFVEFTMPATQVSHMTVRSVSLQNHDSDDPPEKYVRYLARHEYIVGIERTSGQAAAAYALAASVERPCAPAAPATPKVPEPPSSDSDSD